MLQGRCSNRSSLGTAGPPDNRYFPRTQVQYHSRAMAAALDDYITTFETDGSASPAAAPLGAARHDGASPGAASLRAIREELLRSAAELDDTAGAGSAVAATPAYRRAAYAPSSGSSSASSSRPSQASSASSGSAPWSSPPARRARGAQGWAHDWASPAGSAGSNDSWDSAAANNVRRRRPGCAREPNRRGVRPTTPSSSCDAGSPAAAQKRAQARVRAARRAEALTKNLRQGRQSPVRARQAAAATRGQGQARQQEQQAGPRQAPAPERELGRLAARKARVLALLQGGPTVSLAARSPTRAPLVPRVAPPAVHELTSAAPLAPAVPELKAVAPPPAQWTAPDWRAVATAATGQPAQPESESAADSVKAVASALARALLAPQIVADAPAMFESAAAVEAPEREAASSEVSSAYTDVSFLASVVSKLDRLEANVSHLHARQDELESSVRLSQFGSSIASSSISGEPERLHAVAVDVGVAVNDLLAQVQSVRHELTTC